MEPETIFETTNDIKKPPEEILGRLDFTVFLLNYSIIVATRPEPTVRPPSRFIYGAISVLNHCILGVFIIVTIWFLPYYL